MTPGHVQWLGVAFHEASDDCGSSVMDDFIERRALYSGIERECEMWSSSGRRRRRRRRSLITTLFAGFQRSGGGGGGGS